MLRTLSTSDKKPVQAFEFQAPKDDTYKNFESTKNFIRRYLFLFPFAIYAAYNLLFTKRNEITRNTELKLGAYWIENKVIGPMLSSKLLKAYDGKVFKQETEECQMV